MVQRSLYGFAPAPSPPRGEFTVIKLSFQRLSDSQPRYLFLQGSVEQPLRSQYIPLWALTCTVAL